MRAHANRIPAALLPISTFMYWLDLYRKPLFGLDAAGQLNAFSFCLMVKKKKKRDTDKIILPHLRPIEAKLSLTSRWNGRRLHTNWRNKEAGDKNKGDKTVHFNYGAIKSQSKVYYTPLTSSLR